MANREGYYNQPQPICPRCGHVYDTNDMHAAGHDLYAVPTKEERLELTCPACHEPFWLQGSYSPEYSSAVKEEDLD